MVYKFLSKFKILSKAVFLKPVVSRDSTCVSPDIVLQKKKPLKLKTITVNTCVKVELAYK